MFYILKGAGYDVWSDADDLEAYYEEAKSGKALKAPYKVGTLCGVPAGPHWHHHYSTHPTEPLRYLAINPRRVFDKAPGSED